MTIRDVLWEIAVDQYGFVTTQDARNLAIPVVELTKLAHRGQLTKVAHGAYRFDQMPVTERDEYALAVLWTGRENTALASETALAVYELCDINPSAIHLAVPRGARVRRSGGENYVLHREDLTFSQLDWWNGIRAVTPIVAIQQGIRGGVGGYLIQQAIATARNSGLITKPAAGALSDQLGKRT